MAPAVGRENPARPDGPGLFTFAEISRDNGEEFWFAVPMYRQGFLWILSLSLVACGGSSSPPAVDPGTGPWELVPREEVRAVCGLDPDLLDAADAQIDAPYAVVRYGRLCHEYLPEGSDPVQEVFSTTKTLGALVTGIAAWETRDLPDTGRKTGPITVNDPVAHWLDDFSFNQAAKIGHVLGMVGFNENLEYPNRRYVYDTIGTREINRLSDVINTALQQDPERLGADLEEFTHRFLFDKLGMNNSVWTPDAPGSMVGLPDKIFGFNWHSTVRDMARIGQLILRGGVWNGERILAEEFLYEMTHPSFEEANPNYGYLTWLAAPSNVGLFGPCAPAARWNEYPHGELSGAPDCNYTGPVPCEQEFDVGAWSAIGLQGQVILGQSGLDLVLVGKYMAAGPLPAPLWDAVRPALVAEDPEFSGDEEAFCEAYGANRYAPDLRR